MNAIAFFMGIIAFSFLAFIGYWLVSGTLKNNPETTRETARELIIGIMGGAIVAISVVASEIVKGMSNYPFFILSLVIAFILYFAICLIIFIAGVACWLGSLNKK